MKHKQHALLHAAVLRHAKERGLVEARGSDSSSNPSEDEAGMSSKTVKAATEHDVCGPLDEGCSALSPEGDAPLRGSGFGATEVPGGAVGIMAGAGQVTLCDKQELLGDGIEAATRCVAGCSCSNGGEGLGHSIEERAAARAARKAAKQEVTQRRLNRLACASLGGGLHMLSLL
jgi:hypothetical protein